MTLISSRSGLEDGLENGRYRDVCGQEGVGRGQAAAAIEFPRIRFNLVFREQ